MALKPLKNSDWSFDSLCFVCDQTNERGLGVQFFHDTDGGRVTADLALGRPYSGAPNYVHGGAIAAVLDEAMAWAIIALAERFGITRQSQVSYRKPLLIDQPYRVEAWVDSQEGRNVVAKARIASGDEIHSESEGTYWAMNADEARKAIGALKDSETSYVRD